MVRLRACPLLLTFALGFLSCRTPTQIVVELRGSGFACQAGSEAVGHVGQGVLARSSIAPGDGIERVDASTEECADGDGDGRLELGSVVLLPVDDTGHVEIVAVAALASTLADAPAVSIDSCLATYMEFLAEGKTREDCAVNEPCALCIFARRSLGFVPDTRLGLAIDLDNDCAGVLCGSTLTCVAGECVSADTTCPDGNCSLVGGAPAEGGGGAGGTGGTGGTGGVGGTGGGGADPGPWVEVLNPLTSDSIDAYDVVGVEGAASTIYIAAGRYMLEATGRRASVVDGGSSNQFLAVAAPPAGTDAPVQAIGHGGIRTSSGYTLPVGMTWTPPAADVTHMDLAIVPGTGPGSGTTYWTYTDSSGEVESNDPQLPGLAPSASGAVLFTSAVDDDTKGAFVMGSNHWGFVGANNAFVSHTSTAQRWSLWAPGGSPYAFAAANTSTGLFQLERMPSGQLAPPVYATAGGGTDRYIQAIWGDHDANGAVRIWAVGELMSQPWLGHALMDGGQVTWSTDKLAPGIEDGIKDLRTIWVGSSEVVIGGASGVFRAPKAELLP